MPNPSSLAEQEQDQMDIGNNSSEALRSGIERIERLEEEKKGILDDIKDVYNELKATGFDTKTMRKMVALRKLSAEKRQEMLSLEETYMAALGLL